MQTYTLLFRHPDQTGPVQAVTFDAPSAQRAVQFVRGCAVPDRCELWTEGEFVCALRLVCRNGGRWIVASDEIAADVEVRIDSQA
jgi:hypothetical protein